LLPLEIFTHYVAVPSDRAAAAAMAMTLTALALSVNYGIRVWVEREKAGR
jgi:hypothetical protein